MRFQYNRISTQFLTINGLFLAFPSYQSPVLFMEGDGFAGLGIRSFCVSGGSGGHFAGLMAALHPLIHLYIFLYSYLISV